MSNGQDSVPSVVAKSLGHFKGDVAARWENGGGDRKMILLEAFTFVDRNGKHWTAPVGIPIDGASIPPALLSFIDPYIGPYRRASVVHDFYCIAPHTERDKDVHQMFYDAALAGGTPEPLAYGMWMAVLAGGPHWKDVEVQGRRRHGPWTRCCSRVANGGDSARRAEDVAARRLGGGAALSIQAGQRFAGRSGCDRGRGREANDSR